MLALESVVLLLMAVLVLIGLAIKTRAPYAVLWLIVLLLIHFIFGHPRWQFLPVYFLMAFGGIGLCVRRQSQHYWWRRVYLALGILALLKSIVFVYLFPIFFLPETTGDYYLVTETKTLGQGKNVFKIWYPTQDIPKESKAASYYENIANRCIMGMPSLLLSHLKLVKTNALTLGNEIELKYPLVLYSHGASSIMVDNSALLEEIASHGYVVIAVEHNFSFEKYGIDVAEAKNIDASIQKKLIDTLLHRAVPSQINDYQNLMQELKTSEYARGIDFNNIGLIGHSLGGATVTSLPFYLENVAAVVNIDGPIRKDCIESNSKPFLYLSSFSPELSDGDLRKFKVSPDFYRDVKNYELERVKEFISINADHSSWVRFKTANHLDLTDMPFVIPFLASKGYDKKKSHELKCKIIVDFLDRYMKNMDSKIDFENNIIEWIKR